MAFAPDAKRRVANTLITSHVFLPYTMKNIRFLLLISLILTETGLADPGNIPEACVRCHGPDGIATQPGTPHLNGQIAAYLQESMRQFAQKKRPTTITEHIAGPLPSEAWSQEYANSRAKRPTSPTLDPQKIAVGGEVFRSRCNDCHLDYGRESDKDAPLMAGQDLDYLITQAKAFMGGQRKFAFLMDEAYKGLSPADLEAVSHFFASQEQFAPPKGKKKRKGD